MLRKVKVVGLAMKRQNKGHTKQEGAALIFLVTILVLAVTAFALHSLTGNEYKAERELMTAKALVDAKSALIAWSVMQNNPGQLPCPEDTTLIGFPIEGQAQTNCTSPNPIIGRLPWRTLGIGEIKDGNGDKLWYVISPGYRVSPINSSIFGQLSIDGAPNSASAIILSAGVPLLSQTRPMPTNIAPPVTSQYLDGSNNDGNASFVSKGAVISFNDRLIAVKQSELFSPVTNRILRMIKGDSTQGLVKFYPANGNNYPFADLNADGIADNTILLGTPSYQAGANSLFFNAIAKAALLNNGWFSLTSYAVTASKQSVTLTLNGKTLVIP